jgi:hypothetical protein
MSTGWQHARHSSGSRTALAIRKGGRVGAPQWVGLGSREICIVTPWFEKIRDFAHHGNSEPRQDVPVALFVVREFYSGIWFSIIPKSDAVLSYGEQFYTDANGG